MELGNYTLDQLKTLHNTRLADARESANVARQAREEIERRDRSYHGCSVSHLSDGERSLYLARTFKDTPFDLASSENPYRG
jgi:hypothetical protein